jgi:hypothetical protein
MAAEDEEGRGRGSGEREEEERRWAVEWSSPDDNDRWRDGSLFARRPGVRG